MLDFSYKIVTPKLIQFMVLISYSGINFYTFIYFLFLFILVISVLLFFNFTRLSYPITHALTILKPTISCISDTTTYPCYYPNNISNLNIQILLPFYDMDVERSQPLLKRHFENLSAITKKSM